MELIIPILINCILVFIVYVADKFTLYGKLSKMKKQIIVGVLFGCSSAFASSFGVDWLGATVNVRDAAPLSAGLIFGGPAGIIAGLIGGIYRWFSVYWGGGLYTQVACSIATILVGFIAAGVRKLMFDDKKPTWVYGVCIAITCEVIHMILIFCTNMDNSSYAFEFVKGATIPMILGNSVAVGISLIIVSLLSREYKNRNKKNERISQTFQRWLLTCVVIAFIATSLFTLVIQNGISKIETLEEFTIAIGDVEEDIKMKSDNQLLDIAEMVKIEYDSNQNVTSQKLLELAEKYNIKEINIVNELGIIINSTEEDVINNYDMNSKPQSKEFVDVLKEKDYFVQEYSPRGKDETVWRKYAAIKLNNGGFIQVGYDAEQFHQMINEFVIDVTRNRHVGTSGFIAVLDENLNLVADEKYFEIDMSSIVDDPTDEMKKGITATKLYYANILNKVNNHSEEYMYVFKFIEGYCIVAAIPMSEAMFMRDVSLYTSVFMQILIFATLFIFIYILIKRVIINNLQKINTTLGRITGGDLNVVVDVRSNEEFVSLSEDINSTVSTLKRYINEAAARIDKELEYAKQIQLSALPTNFPKDEVYSIYAQMLAAKEVGGDFYDFYKLNDTTIAFLVADVSGKGIPAAMFMMRAKTILKDLAESGIPVNDIFTKANEKLCENNESGMFVTAWMCIIDISTGNMQFANAGHNPPLLKRTDGSFEYLKTRPGLVLAGMEGIQYRCGELTLQPGDRIFLYTDGVTEATNESNVLFGEERLYNFMNENINLEASKLLTSLKNRIDEFVGDAPQFDDITMLIFDYKPKEMRNVIMNKVFLAKIEELNNVIGFVESTLEKFDCSLKIQTALCVAIEEIFVNIAKYAYPNGDGYVHMHISFDEDTRVINFKIIDEGVPFNPLNKADPDISLSAEDRQIGGLGIFITKKTMDNVIYTHEDNKNILIMIKKI